MRSHPGLSWLRGTACAVVLVAVGLMAGFVGCGEQDLYSPPTSPYEIVGRLSLPSENYGVDVVGDFAYVAGGQAGLHVVDISDPTHPVLVSTHDTKKRADAVRVIASPQPDGSYLYIALVVEGTEGLTTYNVTDPDSVVVFDAGSTAVDGKGLHIDVPDDPNEPYIVYLAESWKGMRVFRSLPGEPGKIDYWGVFNSTRGYALAVDVVDGFAYVADDEMGLTVMDVRVLSPGQVEKVAYCDTPGNARDIDVVDGYAYMSSGGGGLQILKVNGEETPVLVSTLELNGDSDAIEVRDGTAFVAADDGGLHVIDVRNPAAPVLMGTILTPDAHDVALGENGLVVIADEGGELIIFRGPRAFEDLTHPGAVFNLTATAKTATSIELIWSAPGDDGFIGQASTYDIRYSMGTITDANWDSTTQYTGESLPGVAGHPDTLLISELDVDTDYFFALKTADDVPLWSNLSNVATARTLLGAALVGGSVSPMAATPDSVVTFSVTYSSSEGYAPGTYEVVIDGSAFDMTDTGGDYVAGVVFEYGTTLAPGSHEYTFSFDDGHGNSAETDPETGPLVGLIIFEMGSPAGEAGRNTDEVLHTVVLTRDIVAATHEVTQAEYELRMGTDPSYFDGDNRPVERVTWRDAVLYCNALSVADGYTSCYTVNFPAATWDQNADGYRLPTEAEWEYLCRAGTGTAFFTGDLTDETCGLDAALNQVGWYCGNADSSTHDVEQLLANDLGVYDAHGNVREWCWDYYASYETDVVIDPSGPATGDRRVIRGGSWDYFARECRSAQRGAYWPNSGDDFVGFRVVRNAP